MPTSIVHPLNLMQLSLSAQGTSFVARFSNRENRPYSRDAFRLSGDVPERKKLSFMLWQYAATEATVLVIHRAWPRAQIEFSNEAEVTYDFLLTTAQANEQNAIRSARYFEDGTIPSHTQTLHDVHPLSAYQQVALINATASVGYALFMEQGTGKTPIVIARVCNAACALKENGRMYRCLIVAPKNVRMNWASEFEKFTTCGGRVTVLRGGEVQRAKQMVEAFSAEPGDEFVVVICSYETMTRAWPILKMVLWDLTVLDESHFIKSPRSLRAKTAMLLRERSQSRMVLTGTPITNHPLDLYTQFEFLGRGCSGFSSWKAFREFYGVFETSHAGFKRLIDCQNMPLLQDRLARQAFIIHKEVALPDLPEKLYDVIEVEMSVKQAEVYKEVTEQLVVELSKRLDIEEETPLTINNVLTRLLKLAQITSGFVAVSATFDDEGNELTPRKVLPFTPNPKIDVLLELLQEKGPKEKTLIWACWVQDIQAIHDALKHAGILHVLYYGATTDAARVEAEYAYNSDPATQVFVGNPQAGGLGLNLLGYDVNAEIYAETNTTQVVYFSQNWSSTTRSQSEDRPHRRGTRSQIRITDLCVPKTIDEEIRARVLAKREVAYKISDIRVLLSTLLKEKG